MHEVNNAPPPGSDEAIAAGCTCPVLDNGHGRGAQQDENGEWQFWTRGDCPLHGTKEEQPC